MKERKDPPDYNGGKYPANDRGAAKGLALAEFIDVAGTGGTEEAAMEGSFGPAATSRVPTVPVRRQLIELARNHPISMTAAATALGFTVGVAATLILSSRKRPGSGTTVTR